MNPDTRTPYCHSRRVAVRQWTREVMIGDIGVGGRHPIRVQSMTTTDTLDIEGTVKQSIALAEAGCEIVRITAPNTKAAAALGQIRKKLRAAGIGVPLVADIHFTPNAAMEAAEHVEKVRINPGNYADRKKFKIRDYSDDQYEEELERLHEAFSPIVIKCRELGRAMRIGTNHGSLSDRIMNRYGDTPLGMVESALEFIRICESHGFRDIILSMKSSNPKVMVEAYRLAVGRMQEEGMHYPLHLGVTEAGDGEDARIKSTVGIGTLLYDGLGDTIRVSLTEDPVYEVPVAQELARRAEALWARNPKGEVLYARGPEPATGLPSPWADAIDPYAYAPRPAQPIQLASALEIGPREPPAVFIPAARPLAEFRSIIQDVARTHARLRDARIEGLMVEPQSADDWGLLHKIREAVGLSVKSFVITLPNGELPAENAIAPANETLGGLILHRRVASADGCRGLPEFLETAGALDARLALTLDRPQVPEELETLLRQHPNQILVALDARQTVPDEAHPLGQYRVLADALAARDLYPPLWIRLTPDSAVLPPENGQDRLIEGSLLAGALLVDGIGNVLSLETEADLTRATSLAYNVLQGAKARISKTEFVACPSCGRTLFDLQSTTRKIRERTDHLKGVTIAIMGCIVNGPGEMADADFGYVGGAPGKVNLYIGKTPVKYNVPEAQAVERLVDLIKGEGKWIEPPAEVPAEANP